MMTYARSRLWVGILSVGTWVIISTTIILMIDRLPQSLRILSIIDSILSFLFLYILISMPFDFVGGFLFPVKYERSKINLTSYLLSYIRGILFHSTFLFIIAFIILSLFERYVGSYLLFSLLISNLFIQGLLGIFQTQIAKIVSEFKNQTPSNESLNVEVWESSDIGFTGGIPLFSKKQILPLHWMEHFSSDEVRHLLNRRKFLIKGFQHLSGIGGAMIFNLIGIAIGYTVIYLSGVTLEVQGYFYFLLLWASTVSLWSFLGLLILPTFSQMASLYGDLFWREEDKVKIAHLIEKLDALQDKEPTRQKQIQRIFHPIASVDLRVRALESAKEHRKGAWHIARYTLFYSWSTLSFMGRAVHCNVGRPNLWVFLPSDG